MAELSIPIVVDWNDIEDHLVKSDIVKVVRCKDCKFYKQLDGTCPYLGEDGYYKELPGKDDFCSRGERKE